MSEFRRRLMMVGGGGGDTGEYIQDGLILHLDGADFDGTQWLDRVANIPFLIRVGTPVKSGNGVYFNGGAGMYSTTSLGGSYTDTTIEVVLKADNSSGYKVVFFQGARDKIAYILNPSNVSYTTRNVSRPTKNKGDVTKIYTHSISNTTNYFNKSSLTNGSNETWNNAASYGMVIGEYRYGSTFQYPFYGYIYQIRIYNRVLTEDEILHNQTIDIDKYNIEI